MNDNLRKTEQGELKLSRNFLAVVKGNHHLATWVAQGLCALLVGMVAGARLVDSMAFARIFLGRSKREFCASKIPTSMGVDIEVAPRPSVRGVNLDAFGAGACWLRLSGQSRPGRLLRHRPRTPLFAGPFTTETEAWSWLEGHAEAICKGLL